jgi:hypothetical protein
MLNGYPEHYRMNALAKGEAGPRIIETLGMHTTSLTLALGNSSGEDYLGFRDEKYPVAMTGKMFLDDGTAFAEALNQFREL